MRKRIIIFMLCLLVSACDPRWHVGHSKIVDNVAPDECVRSALLEMHSIVGVIRIKEHHYVLSGEKVKEPSSFHFETELGIAYLWYTKSANDAWEVIVAYQDIGSTPPAEITRHGEEIMREIHSHVHDSCFNNNA